MGTDFVLEFHNIYKSFDSVRILDNISFNIERGTVHGLVGENGAGKSTLIKILAGIHKADSGEMLIDGKPCSFCAPRDAMKCGVSVIHQELKSAESLNVAENVFLGSPITENGIIDMAQMRLKTKALIDELSVDIDPNAAVSSLSVAKKQIVEIMRALNRDAKILVMDEPSAVLTERELSVFFDIINRLRDDGITVIYISHRLDEVFKLCDNVTVLRDGNHIDTVSVRDIDKTSLIAMMVGHDLGKEYPKEICHAGETVLEVRNLTCGMIRDASFSVRKGEIFGIAGIVGSGRTELVRAIVGIDRKTGGNIFVRGKKTEYKNFQSAVKDGIGLIPEDRKLQGLVQMMPIYFNMTLTNLKKLCRFGIIQKQTEMSASRDLEKKLKLTASSLFSQVSHLSGGNQQKVVIAKWLFRNSDILFLDEPTRGVDVGAKTEIYHIINDMVKDGKTVIMISSDMPELIGMCDRLIVMREGRNVCEMEAKDATQEKILALCT